MEIKNFLKSLAILLLVGSTIVFSNPMVRKSVETVEETPMENTDNIGIDVDFKEVMMWIFILSCLGAAIYVLVSILAKFSKLDENEFITIIYDSQNISSPT